MLDELAIKFGTDKSSRIHFYTKHYEKHFGELRNRPLKLLEIGVYEGSSLKMWKEYFPNATIFGMDINNLKHLEEDRITILTGSQTDVGFLVGINQAYGPFDIVIDDGSHLNNDMIQTFNFFIRKIGREGYYIVEDLHCCYWDTWCGNSIRPSFTDEIKKLVDSINARGKTGYADPDKDHLPRKSDIKTYLADHNDQLDAFWEREIESMTLYRSIVFIKRR